MEKQKTAVEFLYEFVQLKLTNEQQMQFEGLFQQAKQMEKEQIIEAFEDGFVERQFSIESNAKHYYESKYGKDETQGN